MFHNILDDLDARNELTKVTLYGTPAFKLGELAVENGIIQFIEGLKRTKKKKWMKVEITLPD